MSASLHAIRLPKGSDQQYDSDKLRTLFSLTLCSQVLVSESVNCIVHKTRKTLRYLRITKHWFT